MILRLETVQNDVISEEKISDFDWTAISDDLKGVEARSLYLKGVVDLGMVMDHEEKCARDVQIDFGWSLKDRDMVFRVIIDEDKLTADEE